VTAAGLRHYPAPVPTPAPRADLPQLAVAVLRWYDRGHRDLPWRRNADPWGVLVSEIMLQQTTVAAVVPYYERFLARWPGAGELAECDDDELRAAWAGLGYYRRAGLLKRAAQHVTRHGMPADRDGLLELPGVGPYTAAAVASIALGQDVAVVDGNVERVLCRLHGLELDPRKAAGKRALHAAAEALLARERPGDFNQALMELGATVCRPRSPRCAECPLRAGCTAHASGEPERWPPPAPRPAWRDVTRVALLASRRGRVLLVRRKQAPNEGFLELPGRALSEQEREACGLDGETAAPDRRSGTVPSASASRSLAEHLLRHLAEAHGLCASGLSALRPHRHVITRHRILVLPFAAEQLSGRPRGGASFVDLTQTVTPTTTATRRMLARALPPTDLDTP